MQNPKDASRCRAAWRPLLGLRYRSMEDSLDAIVSSASRAWRILRAYDDGALQLGQSRPGRAGSGSPPRTSGAGKV
jgi:hypothetical protein